MKKIIIPLFTFTFALHLLTASAITATEEYVDRCDAETLQAAKDYTDAHGGVNTNAVRTLVDASFVGGTNAVNLAVTGTVVTATNDITKLKAQKLDGPTVAPTNDVSASGKAADAKLTGIALTNRYTRAEVDMKLDGKLNTSGGEDGTHIRWEDGEIGLNADLYVYHGRGISLPWSADAIRLRNTTMSDDSLLGWLSTYEFWDRPLARKPEEGYVSGNLTALDANGDLADSGIAKEIVATTNLVHSAVTNIDAKLTGKIDKIARFSVTGTVVVTTGDGGLADSRIKFTKEDNNVFLEYDYFSAVGISSYSSVNAMDDVYAYGDGNEHQLTLKANRAESGDDDDELATLDEYGNPTRSGINTIKGLYGGRGIELEGGDTRLGSDGYALFTANKVHLSSGWSSLSAFLSYESDEQTLPDYIDLRVSATDPTFSNAVMGVASHTNADFAAEVLAVQVASLSTNITAEVYIAATNACANLGIDPALIPGDGTIGTVGGFIAMLFVVVFWMRKKIFDNSGKVNDTFATNLLGKSVAKTALMIPLKAKTDSFAAEDGHAYAVTMTGTVTITMPTTTVGKAAIFQARFSAAAQQSVQFDTDDVVKFDGTDCGIVKAGKDALLSAMWNGEAWDLVWKNEA